MHETNESLTQLLNSLVSELDKLGLWQESRPSDEALNSSVPFCMDTLAFEQWLQFVFIEKLRLMMQLGKPLPSNIAICPMAEEAFAHHGEDAANIINTIADIDELLSGTRQQQNYIRTK
ncbi:YqcC family protein [Thalassotalea fusca]